MTSSQSNVPALRFRDEQGKEYPDLEKKKLGAIGYFTGGGTPDTGVRNFWEGSIPWISSSDIRDDDLINIHVHRYITKEAVSSSATKVVPANSVLFVSRVGIGKLAVTGSEICTSQDFTSLTLKNDVSTFVGYLFQASKNILLRRAQGTSIKGFTSKDLKSIRVFLPRKKEQQKIAAFLSSVDTKIEQLTRKKSLLEQYKKGLMQKLFSQEIRFKDERGEEYPDWEEVKFGDLYSFKTTNSFSREKLNYKKGKIRNIHYGDIHTKYKARFILGNENVPFLSININFDSISGDTYCKKGDLVIADASEDYEGVGKTIELLDLNDEPVLAGLHTLLARLNSDRIYIGYGTYVMACDFVRRKVMKIAQGTKVLGISMGRMNEIELPIPDKEEQQKIANFFSAIDKKIELVAEQLEQAQIFKKGLLQQMFI